jgi:sensor histidine kinase regulating citrate/malate metabolism
MLITEKQYREEMQTFMSVIRSQRHDYNFHVQTLHGLLHQKDYDACEAYLDNLMHDCIDMNRLLPLADTAISALILSFQSQASQLGIKIDISIENDLSQIATNVYETNKIIGNLLQNAIDETAKLKDKSYGIHLSILKRGEFCIIHVSNLASSIQPMSNYQFGHSDKQGHEGIGVASIRVLALRYGGTVYSRMEGNVIHFIAKIPFILAKEAR